MTRDEWIAARRAMLAKATPPRRDDAEPGGTYHLSAADASIIVAAVNEQEAVVRLVEAVAHLDAAESEEARRYRMTYVREALAALVGEQEKSG